MDIKSSQDFSYAKLKSNYPRTHRRQQQTQRAGSMSVQGIVISYAVRYKHILTGYWGDNKYIVPLYTTYCFVPCNS